MIFSYTFISFDIAALFSSLFFATPMPPCFFGHIHYFIAAPCHAVFATLMPVFMRCRTATPYARSDLRAQAALCAAARGAARSDTQIPLTDFDARAECHTRHYLLKNRRARCQAYTMEARYIESFSFSYYFDAYSLYIIHARVRYREHKIEDPPNQMRCEARTRAPAAQRCRVLIAARAMQQRCFC